MTANNSPLPEAPELLSVAQVALMLDCSKRHVSRLADVGKMPQPFRLGRLVRWRKSDLLKWIESGCGRVV